MLDALAINYEYLGPVLCWEMANPRQSHLHRRPHFTLTLLASVSRSRSSSLSLLLLLLTCRFHFWPDAELPSWPNIQTLPNITIPSSSWRRRRRRRWRLGGATGAASFIRHANAQIELITSCHIRRVHKRRGFGFRRGRHIRA